MNFETHVPRAPYDRDVAAVFHYWGLKPDHSIERVVPTGDLFVLFELDGIERHTYDNVSLEPNASYRAAWVSGVHRNYLSISAHQDSEMMGIQFKAYGAHAYLHVSLDRLADRVVAGADIVDGSLIPLRDELKAAPTSAKKFEVAEAWLEARHDETRAAPETLIQVVEAMQQQPAAKLNEIVERYAGSQKHLIANFKKFIGITPKQYQRILRFNDVFQKMQANERMTWSDIAHACGYSDQSHFIREFKEFSGFIPEGFRREQFEGDPANFFPLDREG